MNDRYDIPPRSQDNQYTPAPSVEIFPEDPQPAFPTQGKELFFALMSLLSGLCLCNFTLFGGFHLGFAIAAMVCIWCSFGYLVSRGHRPTAYSFTLLALATLCAAGFGRSDDGFVKFVLVCFLFLSVNLGLCVTAKQNLRCPGSMATLLDAPRTMFVYGFGRIHRAVHGLHHAFHRTGTTGRNGGAFLLGLCFAIPILAIVIPLLISADAAFDGLVGLLPEFKFYEFVATAVLGSFLSLVLYARGIALHHNPKKVVAARQRKGLNAITVNTALCAVCVVYIAYLISQLAYFSGGFAGILPEQYTMAEYARRGFFEMAWLCAINLGLITLSLGLVRKESRAPVSTRLICLFIGLVTLFLVATASAKMFLYIGAYGLTRLRVLTQIIMLFFALTAVIVMLWLFLPKLPYMKAVLICAMLLGAITLWADVDTCVAQYNVDAYLSGRLETVDIQYLGTLSDGAVPYIAKLQSQSPEAHYSQKAEALLKKREQKACEDFRGWNYVNHAAKKYLPPQETP